MFDLVVLCAGAFGGAVTAVAGFGVGSLLTPAIAAEPGTKLAVTLVSIPHAIGTSIRFWLTGYAKRWRLRGTLAWLAGALSGFFGGLVGNQGGIRTAAMLGFEVDKRQFVATTTAVALLIDMARVPVYALTETAAIAQMWPMIGVATIGVVFGTLVGERLLTRVPERRFRVVVGTLLLALGVSYLIG